MLDHLAMRGTRWPEHCKGAVDELISAIKEVSSSHNGPHPTVDRTGAPTSEQQAQEIRSQPTHPKRQRIVTGIGRESERSLQAIVPNQTPHAPNPIEANDRNTPGVATETVSMPNDMNWNRLSTPTARASQNQVYQSDPVDFVRNQGPSSPSRFWPQASDEMGNVELADGQQPMMWYDQIFASSFSAIDNPFLVAAEFDASIDPTWNYLT